MTDELPIPPRMPSEPNPEYVRMLEEAKCVLWDGVDLRSAHTTHICSALSIVATDDADLPLCAEIEGRLGGYGTYRTWVVAQCGNMEQPHPNAPQTARQHWVDSVEDRHINAFTASVQRARHRWIRQLIEEFS